MRSIKIAPILIVLCCGFQAANADWVKRNSNSLAWFRDIQCLTGSKGWSGGTDGVLFSTEDSGSTWVQAKKTTNDAYIQIHFVDETTGWLLCERDIYTRGKNPTSYLRKTVNGGRTWEKVEFPEAGRERMTKLLFSKDGRGTAFGEGGIFYTLQDDGLSWKKSRTAIRYLLLNGGYSDDKAGAIVGAGGTIMFTEDAGRSWKKATLVGDPDTRFNAIYFAGHNGAWAVGSSGRIFRSTSGRLWQQQVSGVTADLNDVFFTSATSGWTVGEAGIILRTRDAGNTWIDVNSRTRHRLEKIVFNGNRGWAVGFGGTILTYDDGPATSNPNAKPVLMRRG